MPATEPEPAPASVQVASPDGPRSVSDPAAPSSAIGTGSGAAATSKESSPSPPVTPRLVTVESGRVVAVPSTLTTRSVALAETTTVWAALPARLIDHTDAAAGAAAGVELVVAGAAAVEVDGGAVVVAVAVAVAVVVAVVVV
jgi:hypothetical protein